MIRRKNPLVRGTENLVSPRFKLTRILLIGFVLTSANLLIPICGDYGVSRDLTDTSQPEIDSLGISPAAYDLEFSSANAYNYLGGSHVFTGLAYGVCTDNKLIGSSNGDDRIYEIDMTSGSLGTLYPFRLGGSAYDHIYGDMASGI